MIAYYWEITYIIGVTILQCLLEIFLSFCAFICTLGHYPYNVGFLIFIYVFSIIFFVSFVLHIILLVRYLKGEHYKNVEKIILLIVFIVETIFLGILVIYDIIIYGIHHDDIDYRIIGEFYFLYQVIFNYLFVFLHCLYSFILLRHLRNYSALSIFGCCKKEEKERNVDENKGNNNEGKLNEKDIKELKERSNNEEEEK